MDVRINTCYVVKIQNQLDAVPDKKTGKLEVYGKRMIDDRLVRHGGRWYCPGKRCHPPFL